jgi:DNA repair protein RadA/Sms
MKTQFACQDCGSVYSKWTGRCDACGSWNRILEESFHAKKTTSKQNTSTQFVSLGEESVPLRRFLTGMGEFDRVCGGGLVPGSVILVGGDPGIGKSTLLLQVAAHLAQQHACAYISGEEAIDQIRMRAMRLQAIHPRIHLTTATQVGDIINGLQQLDGLAAVIIDSIQTMVSSELESAPGTVSQVRASAQELINYAKKHGVAVILVGHVTKEGTLAGPRVLEHMVDSVLYFEGEQTYHYRLLRAVKNRFGATDEIGVFEMTEQGLRDIKNPSALFLSQRNSLVSGSAIFASIEGTRPILCEIQALAAPTYLATPRRTAVGWDSGRLAMILAVLEARCGLSFGNRDVFLNVAGGLKITEPAADLAAAAALVSTLKNRALDSSSVFFGEIGLGGEIRPVRQMLARLREAQKLGFSHAYTATPPKNEAVRCEGIDIKGLNFLPAFVSSLIE